MIHIDLFSDTNSEPVVAMRQAMADARVGNEVAGEDPTVNELLKRVCNVLGKPAATFMPSGTMCNGVAYRVFCQSGDRIIMDAKAHALTMASGLVAGLVGAMPEIIQTERGLFDAKQLSEAIGKNEGYNVSKAKLLSIEQTTNFGGGAIWPLEQLHAVCEVAHENGLATHMDGARLFNAVVATGISAESYCHHFDSVWIDFSKGLGAPMGAVIAGSQEFIEKVWYYKFQQGGTLHQAGIMAAGCLYALDHHIERLTEDHYHARTLAEQLAALPEIDVNLKNVETNIVIFKLRNTNISAYQITSELLSSGIRLLAVDHETLRAIVHMDINEEAINEVVIHIKDILRNS